MSKSLYNVVFTCVFSFAVFFSLSNVTHASAPPTISSLSGWAWSSNIGWISFNCADTSSCGTSNYSVKIATTTASPNIGKFSSYAWSSNIGWISFDPGDLSKGLACPSVAATVDLNTGIVTGWVRAIAGIGRNDGWDGCIELSGPFHLTGNISGTAGVTYHTNDDIALLIPYNKLNSIIAKLISTVHAASGKGIFNGFAWGATNVGWINFGPTIGVSFYGVTLPLGEASVPSPIGGSCTVNGSSELVTVTPGDTVNFNVSPNGGSLSYVGYYWNSGVPGAITYTVEEQSYSYIAYTADTPDGTYTPFVTVKDSTGKLGTIYCTSVKVQAVAEGDNLNLLVGSAAGDLPSGNFDNSSSNSLKYKQIKKGDPAVLRSNLKPAELLDYKCSIIVDSKWPKWSAVSIDSTQETVVTTLLTTSINTGLHNFTLDCQSKLHPLNPKTSTATLNVIKSSIREF